MDSSAESNVVCKVIARKTKISPRDVDFSSVTGKEKLSDEIDSVKGEVRLEDKPYQKQNKNWFTHGFIS